MSTATTEVAGLTQEEIERRFPYRKDLPEVTLDQIREMLPEEHKVLTVENNNITVNLTSGNASDEEPEQGADAVTHGNRTLSFGGVEVEATQTAVDALGSWLKVPTPFLRRLPLDMKQYVLTNLLVRNPGEAAVVLDGDDRLIEVRNPGAKIVRAADLVDIAERVVGEDAQVADFWVSPSDFRLDLFVSDVSDRAVGGDRAIGDITRGGLRMGHDRKNNLAPWVQPFMYRLACTNGMESPDDGLKIDMRGNDLEEVMSEFEAACDRAFKQVEHDIDAFYELRNQPVENPERVIARIARERDFAPRTLATLIELAPSLPDEASMFDVVNLITHLANEDSVSRRDGARRILQRAGGNIVSEHAARCGHCLAKLN